MMNSSRKVNFINKFLDEINKSESLQGLTKHYFIVVNVECLISSKETFTKLNEFHHAQDIVNMGKL